jgi:hypothetical protein
MSHIIYGRPEDIIDIVEELEEEGVTVKGASEKLPYVGKDIHTLCIMKFDTVVRRYTVLPPEEVGWDDDVRLQAHLPSHRKAFITRTLNTVRINGTEQKEEA